MAIDKMALVNIAGLIRDLDMTLLKCCKSGIFHIEHPAMLTDNKHGFHSLEEPNPYTPLLKRVYGLANNISLKLSYRDYHDLSISTTAEYEKYLSHVENDLLKLFERRTELSDRLEKHEEALKQVQHLAGLEVEFEAIFSCQHTKVRFGRLPTDSFSKLSYYDNKTFFFFPFDNDEDYYWGFYVAPKSKAAVIDDIFNSLYFERVRVPDYVHGTAEEAIENINAMIAEERELLANISAEIEEISKQEVDMLLAVYSKLKFYNDTFELRKQVSVINDKFYIVGFAPYDECDDFIKELETIESVSALKKPHDTDVRLTPPIRLKNNRLFSPFEQFVGMYGLPSYGEIDPTPYVAVTYTLLFGMMFGDLGQGLAIFLIGLFVWRRKKNQFGRILTRIGLSSAAFGCVYGSVFGYEDALNPMYKALFGWEHKPIHVFEQSAALLLTAVGVGALLITISIAISIVMGLRRKNYAGALFGANGVAGLVFYVSILAGVTLKMMFDINVVNLAFVIAFIAFPLLLMFLREPLGHLIKHKHLSKPEGGIGGFIAENLVEIFEILLSYVANTMSFLRVGGFVLSHAGMMLVVLVLSEKAAGIGNPIVMILGNIFVMGLEGLIVGIQVLRLEFYEIFSRFFEGNGKPFTPVGVSYENE